MRERKERGDSARFRTMELICEAERDEIRRTWALLRARSSVPIRLSSGRGRGRSHDMSDRQLHHVTENADLAIRCRRPFNRRGEGAMTDSNF